MAPTVSVPTTFDGFWIATRGSFAAAINEKGQIAGTLGPGFGPPSDAFLLDDRGLRVLGSRLDLEVRTRDGRVHVEVQGDGAPQVLVQGGAVAVSV